MIETAGGCYALDDITDEEDNALSTMNMQMEAFYDKAVNADILIYKVQEDG
jgi:iron complex transport system substrate-binding protein